MNRLTVIVVFCLSLSACVTTTTGPSGSTENKGRALEMVNELARSYVAKGNWEAAKRHLSTAIEMDSRNPDTHELMALVLQNTGEIELAESHFKKALGNRVKRRSSKPSPRGGSEARIRNNFGVFLFGEKRYAEAVEQFSLATDDLLYENRASAFLNLGRAHRKLDQKDEAREALRRSRLLDKTNTLTLMELAEVHFELGNYPESQEIFTELESISETPTASRLWLGIRLAEHFGDENALQNRALQLRGRFPNSKEHLEYMRFRAARQ